MTDKEVKEFLNNYEKFGLDEEDREYIKELIQSLHLHVGDTIVVYDTDDEELYEVMEEQGSNKFTVSEFDYYEQRVWVNECNYGIDMQYIANVTGE